MFLFLAIVVGEPSRSPPPPTQSPLTDFDRSLNFANTVTVIEPNIADDDDVTQDENDTEQVRNEMML